MGRSDSLPLISPHFVAFVWRYLRFVPCSSPSAWDGKLWINLELVAGTPAGNHDGNGRVSQVPERPSCPYALFLDPGRTETPGHCGVSARPPPVSTTVAPAIRIFRGSIARHWDSLSTLRSGSFLPPRKTRFRLLAKLCRTGFVNPQGCMEGFCFRVTSPFLELA